MHNSTECDKTKMVALLMGIVGSGIIEYILPFVALFT